MNRRRGCIWFAAGLLLALLAGTVAFLAVQRGSQPPKEVTEEPARVPVLVAVRDIPLHTVISDSDIIVTEVPPEIIPVDAFTDLAAVAGHLTTVDIAQGEIILARRLITPTYVGPRAAFVMSPTQVLIAIPSTDLLSSVGIVRPGDHVDLLLTWDFSKASDLMKPGAIAFTALQDIRVAAVMYSGGNAENPPVAFLLAIDEQDALLLKAFRDTNATMDIALRSPAAEGLFDVQMVDANYIMDRYNVLEELGEWQ